MKEKIIQAIRRALGTTQGFKLKLTFKPEATYEIKYAQATQAIYLDRILEEEKKRNRRGLNPSSPFRFTEEEGARLAEFIYEQNKEDIIKFLHDAIEKIEVVK